MRVFQDFLRVAIPDVQLVIKIHQQLVPSSVEAAQKGSILTIETLKCHNLQGGTFQNARPYEVARPLKLGSLK